MFMIIVESMFNGNPMASVLGKYDTREDAEAVMRGKAESFKKEYNLFYENGRLRSGCTEAETANGWEVYETDDYCKNHLQYFIA